MYCVIEIVIIMINNNKTFYIITIGCQMNKSDSERIAAYLENLGYSEAKERPEADIVVITTCGVRQSAEDRIYGLVAQIEKDNKKAKIVLTGCLSERKDVIRRLGERVDIWLPISELPNLAEKLKKDEISSYKSYLQVEPKYESAYSAFVPIGNGCDNFCTYCVVPYARGREVYRSAKEIIQEVENLIKKGYKEITLIAQNVNSYKDGEINFARLLKSVNDIEGNFWLRFFTSHPKDMSDELIKIIYECPKVCEQIHLPAQAGDDNVLQAMNRKYVVEDYKNLIKKIRQALPGFSITTDIIVGFPGETKKQFENTAQLFWDVRYDMAYIAQYSPRYGTAAAKMEDNVSLEEKKTREEILDKILRVTAKENNQKYLGKVLEVLVENKTKKGEWIGRTRANKVVKIKKRKEKKRKIFETVKIGKFVEAKIDKVEAFGMDAKIV